MRQASTIELLAQDLRTAEQSCTPIPPSANQHRLDDLETAYAVQDANIQNMLKHGRSLAGWKVGLTSAATQRQLGIYEPIRGPLYDRREILCNETANASWFIAPKVEAEIALVIGRDVRCVRDTRTSIKFALSALEIADSRYANWQANLFEAVADGSMASRYLIGRKRVSPAEIDLAASKMTLSKNGQLMSSGTGAECLGDPLNAAEWLAERLIAENRHLRAGDIVLTGALGPAVDACAGDTFKCRISGFDELKLSFG